MVLIYLALSSWVSTWIITCVVTRAAIIASITQRRKLGLSEAKGHWAGEWQIWNHMACSSQSCAHFRKLSFLQEGNLLTNHVQINLHYCGFHTFVHWMMQKRFLWGMRGWAGGLWKLESLGVHYSCTIVPYLHPYKLECLSRLITHQILKWIKISCNGILSRNETGCQILK